MRKSKSLNPSTAVKDEPKVRTSEYQSFRDMFGHSRSISIEYASKLAIEIVEWVKSLRVQDDPLCSYTVEEFYLLKGIPKRTWDDWINRYPDLNDAAEYAKHMLGIIREARALSNKSNVSMIMRVQRHYSPVWNNIQSNEDEIKRGDGGNGNAVIHVNMEQFPNSSLVPEKKE